MGATCPAGSEDRVPSLPSFSFSPVHLVRLSFLPPLPEERDPATLVLPATPSDLGPHRQGAAYWGSCKEQDRCDQPPGANRQGLGGGVTDLY